MKTTISLPDDLFSGAESLAKRLGVSRSALFAAALAEFLAKHAESEVTERLDRLYASEPSTLDPALDRVQRRSVAATRW